MCTLQFTGVHFDYESFLSETSFNQEDLLMRGGLSIPDDVREKMKRVPHAKSLLETFDQRGLVIKVSEETDINLQMQEAILFLKKHKEDLQKMKQYSGIDMIAMKFNCEDNENRRNFDDFPSEFHELLSETGIHTVMF